MEVDKLAVDLLDDDEDDIVRTIELQKSLISKSQSLTETKVELIKCDRRPQNSGELLDISNQNNANSAAEKEETSYHNALAANMEYDNYLSRLETNLKTLISECKSNLDELTHIQKGWRRPKQRVSLLGRNNFLYIYGAPFFKDKEYYPCPPNADTLTKMQGGELNSLDLPPIHWWSPTQTKQLVDAIKESSLEVCKQDARIEKNALIRRLTALKGDNDAEKREKLQKEIETFDVDNIAVSRLNEKICTMDHDWLKLSASVLNGKHTADECRGFWYNYLHPKFYKGNWTEEEIENLRVKAEENKCQNWDLIAEKLGTKRSGYQCFAQYQSELGQISKKWSKAEDDQLKCLVEKLRVGDYIPWSQLVIHMKGRTKTQVYNRWTYSLDPKIKKGRFTVQEDIIILHGVQKWGEDFQKIALYMPNRMAPQIRVRYHSGIAKEEFTPWTFDEDKALLKFISKYGHNWSEIAKYLPGKSSHKIRHRYETISKWQKANPGKPLAEISSRRNSKRNMYNCYPEMWAHAEKLLSGGNSKSASTSLIMTKPSSAPKSKKRSSSLIDEKLSEYFRGSYYGPITSSKKFTSLPETYPKLIADVASFLEILGANLTIPSDEVLDEDPSLEPEDRLVLKGLRSCYQVDVEGRSEIPPPNDNSNVRDETVLPAVDPRSEIDYVPQKDPSSILFSPEYNYVGPYSKVPPTTECPSPLSRTSAWTLPAHPLFGDLKYLCPPNSSTLVGLRSLLLGKRKLVESISEFATDPILTEIDDTKNENFRRANQLWEDRLMCLFALPNLLSKMKPNEVPVEGTSGLFDISRVNLDSYSDIEPVPSTSGTSLVSPGSVMVSAIDKKVHILTEAQGKKRKAPAKRKAGPAKKRAKK